MVPVQRWLQTTETSVCPSLIHPGWLTASVSPASKEHSPLTGTGRCCSSVTIPRGHQTRTLRPAQPSSPQWPPGPYQAPGFAPAVSFTLKVTSQPGLLRLLESVPHLALTSLTPLYGTGLQSCLTLLTQ